MIDHRRSTTVINQQPMWSADPYPNYNGVTSNLNGNLTRNSIANIQEASSIFAGPPDDFYLPGNRAGGTMTGRRSSRSFAREDDEVSQVIRTKREGLKKTHRPGSAVDYSRGGAPGEMTVRQPLIQGFEFDQDSTMIHAPPFASSNKSAKSAKSAKPASNGHAHSSSRQPLNGHSSSSAAVPLRMAESPPLFTTATPLSMDDRCDHAPLDNNTARANSAHSAAAMGGARGGTGGDDTPDGRKRFKARLLTGERGVSLEFGKFVALVSVSGKI